MGYKKRPSKQQLYEQIKALEKENMKLSEEVNSDQLERWNRKLPKAIEEANKMLKNSFGYSVRNLVYVHVDAGGYWFNFSLTNDSRVQTFCVRHYEVF